MFHTRAALTLTLLRSALFWYSRKICKEDFYTENNFDIFSPFKHFFNQIKQIMTQSVAIDVVGDS